MEPSRYDNSVLLLLSFVAVERIFSQVKFIIETTGVSALEESLETRAMERVNHYPNKSSLVE